MALTPFLTTFLEWALVAFVSTGYIFMVCVFVRWFIRTLRTEKREEIPEQKSLESAQELLLNEVRKLRMAEASLNEQTQVRRDSKMYEAIKEKLDKRGQRK